ncbi:BamA/TamA family outer membrane protein [Altererythrobacter salegens]|uniref:BamA/TamA family outer membrane protein n=1 Tax=Croceibacterium salegens TaxID=1737568 RepID=A0A6I4SSU4_9SPHN|nr:BamA/TamA family outer membrane protein [Croceibacterium salegens]
MIAQPAAAQDSTTAPELEDLIPDSAVDNPEDWAKQGAPDAVPVEDDMAIDTALDEMSQLDVPWPDDLELPAVEALAPEQDITFAEEDAAPASRNEGDTVNVSRALTIVFPTDSSLLPERDDLSRRFQELSTIEADNAGDNAAQLAAQSREDEALLERLLRLYGYYDAQVIRSIGGEAAEGAEGAANPAQPSVRFLVLPGTRYALGALDFGDLAMTGADYGEMLDAFGMHGGDPLNSFEIATGQAALDSALGEAGYPFAAIDDLELLVDHDRQEGDLTLKVTPNGKYVFGTVTSNLPKFLSGRHLAEIARFEPGDLYKRSDELDLRRAIQATGLVSTTTLKPVEISPPVGDEPGVVDMQVEMTEAKLRTVKGSIGYGTGEGFKLAGSWEHRNLFPPEGALKVRGIAGTQEQLAGVTFRRNNFLGRDQVLTIDAYATTVDYAAYDAETASLVGTFERLSTLLFQKEISWSGGLELVATRERTAKKVGKRGVWQTYLIAALPGYIQWDTSDNLLDPTRGFRLSARISPEVARTNGVDAFYVRSQFDASYYLPMSDKIVVAGRARIASIPGATVDEIAPSRRLYGGGGGSVRGYGYQKIGPQSSVGDPVGGRSLAEFSLEARIKTGMLGGALGIVPFVDAGTVASGATPDFANIKIGAGIGIRYNTGFGPIRVDFGVPLNPGPNDANFGVYVGLGQAF